MSMLVSARTPMLLQMTTTIASTPAAAAAAATAVAAAAAEDATDITAALILGVAGIVSTRSLM